MAEKNIEKIINIARGIEKDALINKLKYDGMTIMKISTINQYLHKDKTFIKGMLIRVDLHKDSNYINNIYNELMKGVYI